MIIGRPPLGNEEAVQQSRQRITPVEILSMRMHTKVFKAAMAACQCQACALAQCHTQLKPCRCVILASKIVRDAAIWGSCPSHFAEEARQKIPPLKHYPYLVLVHRRVTPDLGLRSTRLRREEMVKVLRTSYLEYLDLDSRGLDLALL